MKVAFLVDDLQLSGGVGVVVAHARQLAATQAFDVTLVVVRQQQVPDWGYEALAHLHVASLEDARARRFDVAVASWWETTSSLFDIPAERYAYFVQSLEDRFYPPRQPERLGAAITLNLPVAFMTPARWIAGTLRDLRPEARCYLVRHGIDKTVFPPPDGIEPSVDAPLRVLVEGYASSWFRGVNQAIATTRLMREPHRVTVVAPNREGLDATGAERVLGPVTQLEMAGLYAQTDVVLELSRVEGMFGPSLQGFHMGATCVTTPMTGHEEYIEHGVNALICDWDDEHGTARLLDLLARDRTLLHRLRLGALETARRWPTWEQSGQFMAAALRAIRREPPAPVTGGAARMLADVRAALEEQRLLLQERNEFAAKAMRLEQIKALPGVATIVRARHRRSIRLAMRVARAGARGLRG